MDPGRQTGHVPRYLIRGSLSREEKVLSKSLLRGLLRSPERLLRVERVGGLCGACDARGWPALGSPSECEMREAGPQGLPAVGQLSRLVWWREPSGVWT